MVFKFKDYFFGGENGGQSLRRIYTDTHIWMYTSIYTAKIEKILASRQ